MAAETVRHRPTKQRGPARVHLLPGSRPGLRQISYLAQGTTELKARGKQCPRCSWPAEVPGISPPAPCVPGQEAVPARMQESFCLMVSASPVGSFLCSDVHHLDKWRHHSTPTQRSGPYRNQREGAACNHPRLASVGAGVSPQMRVNSHPNSLENSHQAGTSSEAQRTAAITVGHTPA